MPDNEESKEEEKLYILIGDFLKRYQEPVGRAIDAWARNLESEPARRLRVVYAIVGIVAVAVITLGILTFVGRVSGDAFAFLIGSIIGYIFSYLRLITTRAGG